MALISGSQTITTANLTDLLDGGASALHSHAVDSAELAAGSVDIAHLSASGSASSSTFLAGNNAWAAAGGGSLVLKQSTLITSNTGSITVTGLTSHDTHLIILSSMIPTADGPYAQLNLGTGVGIIEANDSYAWHHFAIRANSTTPTHTAFASGSEAATIILYRRGVGSATGEGFSAAIWVHYNRTSEACRTQVHGTFNGESYLGEADGGIFQGQTLSTIDLDRVRFMFSGGSIETGRMTVYGLSYS